MLNEVQAANEAMLQRVLSLGLGLYFTTGCDDRPELQATFSGSRRSSQEVHLIVDEIRIGEMIIRRAEHNSLDTISRAYARLCELG